MYASSGFKTETNRSEKGMGALGNVVLGNGKAKDRLILSRVGVRNVRLRVTFFGAAR